MVKRLALILLGVGLLAAIAWRYALSPKIRVQRVADQFWTAVAAGNKATVEGLLAPDAALSADEWLAANQGLSYVGPPAVSTLLPNECQIEWNSVVAMRTPEGVPQFRMATLKRVGDEWRVATAEGRLC